MHGNIRQKYIYIYIYRKVTRLRQNFVKINFYQLDTWIDTIFFLEFDLALTLIMLKNFKIFIN